MTQLLTMGHFMCLEYLARCSGEAMSPTEPVAHLPAPIDISHALGFLKWD